MGDQLKTFYCDDADKISITTDKRCADSKICICAVELGYDEPFESEQKYYANLFKNAPVMLAALEAAVRIKDLWTFKPHEQIDDEHAGEAQALSKMLEDFENVIREVSKK